MPVFVYKVVNSQGKAVEGQLEAPSQEAAMNMLRKKRMKVSSLKKKATEIKIPGLGPKAGIKDVTRFTRQFSAMTSAGLPLLQCLNILQEQSENPAMAEVVKKVAQKIQGGSALAESMGQHPKVFNQLYCHMVYAGEQGGILDGILLRLADYLESAERLRRKIKGAMTYPTIVAFVAVAVVFILMTFVVPKFAEMFSASGNELPLPTQIVMNISDFLRDYVLIIVVGAVVGLIAFLRYIRTEKGNELFDLFLLKAPIIGQLQRKTAIARFTRTLGTLLNAGVSIIDALQVTAKTSGNKILEKAILKTMESITGGNTISEPLKETGIFPPMVVQMIGVGEKTGGLPDMLLKISDFYDEEVNAAVETLTSMIEPLIIVFLGVVIGGILIAMYMPMFSMTDNM